MEATKSMEGTYAAVMLWVPADKVVALNEALPPERTAEPRRAAPSKKFTDPAGVPATETTLAVKMTDWPDWEGFGVEARSVLVGTGFTSCATTAEVEAAKLVDPP